jgi:FKBP-type peptidyl-prolyl cis-trans isomerase
MEKPSSSAILLLASGVMLSINALAQAPAARTSPSTPQAQTAPAANPALPTEKDQISYAIGMNIGTTLHRESMDVDPMVLERGLADALKGGKTLLTEDQAHAALLQAQQKMRLAEEEKIRALAATNKTEGDAFLAANKTKPGVVTLPSGLQYKILQQGTGPKPTADDVAKVNYRGTLVTGKEFDSSYKRGQPASLPVGRVIKGWSEALQLMPVGSKWQIVLPPDLAYGDRGAGPDIGPESTLIFDVELLSIEKAPAPEPGAPATPPASQPR